MDDYDVYHPIVSGQNRPCVRMKGEGPVVSATSAPHLRTVRDLPAIFDPMITLASSPPSNGIALISMLADVVRLIDDELDHLVVAGSPWRQASLWCGPCAGGRAASPSIHTLRCCQSCLANPRRNAPLVEGPGRARRRAAGDFPLNRV